ncbi:MAG TPA: hypothetical protein VFU15_14655 [Bacteroidia bacterium]|nr:hypothetical protein [Bacteroidia bacterium]
MKRLLTALLLVATALNVSAFTFYDQLCTFNFNWKKYAMQAPAGEARNFHSDAEYVQAHLGAVLNILRAEPVDHLSDAQKISRAHLLDLLDGYRAAGKFPVNYYKPYRVPVFIDDNGTHCAVSYLMQQTGNETMAERIAQTDNFAWVKDIRDPGVPSWQEASGLSVDDLKLIQGAYDFYLPDAFTSPDKYATPQKPACITAYFTDNITGKSLPEKPGNIWCKGEGKDGVLNGKWIQNYAAGMPWIEGFFTNGKRSGQWKEYYQGTDKLCRTEHWSNNKLNGTRERYDLSGNLIEEITFSNGNAISKINYDVNDSVAYVRVPIDSIHVWTQVFNASGTLIACGHETVFNPGGLLWFQNIELTALNSASITARSVVQNEANGSPGATGGYYGNNLYNNPPLVQYLKQGDWVYYHDNSALRRDMYSLPYGAKLLCEKFPHFGTELWTSIFLFPHASISNNYDSIHVVYKNDRVLHFYGYSKTDFLHLYAEYYDSVPALYPVYARRGILSGFGQDYPVQLSPGDQMRVKKTGQYTRDGKRTGEWKFYSSPGVLYKTEDYLVPTDEKEAPEQ